MEIEVTGCSNCPFRQYRAEIEHLYCSLSDNLNQGVLLISSNKKLEYRKDIPNGCPIKEGLVIKIKE